MTTIKNEKSKAISIILAFIVLFTCIFSYPIAESHAITVEKLVTKYHLDIGVQQIWGTEDKNGNVIWDNGIGPGDDMNVTTSVPFPQEIYNVKVYHYSASKFQWGEPNYNSNVGSEPYYKINYEDYTSTNIHDVTNVSASGNTVTFSHIAKMSSSLQYNVADKLRFLQIDDIFRLMAGPESLDPKTDVATNFPDLYSKLNQGRNGVDSKVHAYMYFTPVIIQYDVKEMVEIGDFEPDLTLPATAKQGETFTPADASNIDDKITVEEAVLERRFNGGAWEHVITWRGTGTPGENTGERIDQIGNEIGIIEYRITVRVTNGEEKSKIKSIEITDSREAKGVAILNLPEYTYEGHRALAKDESTFEANNEPYSALRMYNENLADNRFNIVESNAGSIKELDWPTYAEAVFEKRGNYHVRLNVDLNIGSHMRLTDTKPIEVRKTPYIIDNLGGTQKQNRKQTLTASVAIYPEKPIVSWQIDLKSFESGESITLSNSNPQSNTASIKTRTVTTDADSSEYFTQFELEFLTKTPSYDENNPNKTEEYQYTIYMLDSKGDSDTVTKTFTVKPDVPPKPIFTVQDSFIRERESNTAIITTEDTSISDGDQFERTWYAAARSPLTGALAEGFNKATDKPGFTDLSFGSRIKVQFEKEGVGEFDIKLHLKDVWTEPTLPEYITDDDYLTGEITKSSKVDNIAPVVSIEPVFYEDLQIDLLTDKNLLGEVEKKLNSLKTILLENQIDARIAAYPIPESHEGESQLLFSKTWRAANNCVCKNCHTTGITDSQYTFIARPASIKQTSTYYNECSLPLTLYCLKGEANGNSEPTVVWSYTGGPTETFTVTEDKTEKYIFLTEGTKTKILSRNTGAYITTLDYTFTGSGYVSSDGKRIYFLENDSIMRYDITTGTYKKAVNVGGSCDKLKKGKLCFLETVADLSKYNICYFDMDDESIKRKAVPEIDFPASSSYYIHNTSINYTDDEKIMFKVQYQNKEDYRYWAYRYIYVDVNSGEKTFLPGVSGKVECDCDFVLDEANAVVGIYEIYVIDEYSYGSSSGYKNLISLSYTPLNEDGSCGNKIGVYSNIAKSSAASDRASLSYARKSTKDNIIFFVQSIGEYWGSSSYYGTPVAGFKIGINADTYSNVSVELSAVYPGLIDVDTVKVNGNVADASYLVEGLLGTGKITWQKFSSYFTETQAEAAALKKYIKDKGNDLILYINNSMPDFQSIYTDVKNKLDTQETVKISLDDSSGTLSKELTLEPQKQYYYEYDIKSLATDAAVTADVNFDMEKLSPVNPYDSTYEVTEEWNEDFNDDKLDSHFIFSKEIERESNQWMCNYEVYHGESRHIYNDTKSVYFTIPQGKKAILSFDYNAWTYNTLAYVRYTLNGSQILYSHPASYNATSAISGKYTHSTLLEAGTYTLSTNSYLSDKSYSFELVAYLDNLSLQFVETKDISTLYTSRTPTYTAPSDGKYKVKIYGPAGNANGGYITGILDLKAGDILKAYLGAGAGVASGVKNGANGVDGNGYGDNGTHKATLSLNDNLISVAGGGGQNGNPGIDDGNTRDSMAFQEQLYKCGYCGYEQYPKWDNGYWDRYPDCQKCGKDSYWRKMRPVLPCEVCGFNREPTISNNTYGHYHKWVNGIGGTAGKASSGGYSCVNTGANGGASSHGYTKETWVYSREGTGNHKNPLYDLMAHYDAVGPGGNGGDGGASWVNSDGFISYSSTPGGSSYLQSTLEITLIDANNITKNYGNVEMNRNIKDGWTNISGKITAPTAVMEYYSGYTAGLSFYDSVRRTYYHPNTTYLKRGIFSLNFTGQEGSEFLIKNLKIYYLSNGQKVYVNDTNNDLSEYNKEWITNNLTLSGHIEPTDEKDKLNPIIYKKGELVRYGINYSDYEADPKKPEEGYWIYAHTPYNDGKHPDAAIIYDADGNITEICGKAVTDSGITLDEAIQIAKKNVSKTLKSSIDRFYVDGKYTVYHWQYDDTSRGQVTGGYPDYDKSSNIAEVPFYIEGGASAPWITHISTEPQTIKEKEDYKIKVGVDDAEKDVLNLTTEVYKEKKLIYTHRQKNITASNSVYPYIYTDIIKDAEVGRYDVVCTVRDQTGAGLGSYKFMVVSDGKITGEVYHTEQWDINRKKFNLSWFKDEVNREYTMSEYMASGSGKMVNSGSNEKPRKRGTNVFWSGEKFMLNAAVAGTPTKVTCQIKDYTYSTVMKNTGKKNKEGEAIYQGAIWEESMINKWGKKEPEQLTFEFTANYAGGTKKTHEVKVIVDDINQYWRLHRVF